MGAIKEVFVPDIGDFKDVGVIEVLVKPGDIVRPEQSLVTLESDKATMEIPSPAAGEVKDIRIRVGDKVSQGALILILEESSGTAPVAAPAPPAAPAPAKAASSAPAAPAPGRAAGGATEVKVPDIGDFKGVEVIEILVKPGDRVTPEQSLITLESDKATMEIPSPAAGVVQDILVKVGDKVAEGVPILRLAAGEAGVAPSAPAAPGAGPPPAPISTATPAALVPAPAAAAAREPEAPAGPESDSALKPHASPSVRKFARELGVDLAKLAGTGPKGRILHADVQAFVKGAMSGVAMPGVTEAARTDGAALGLLPWPQVDFARFGPIETQPLSRIKKLAGANLHRNWVMIPHVTNHEAADITELEAFRVQLNKEGEKSGVKVTMLAFLIKAVVAALQKFPEFNASLDGEKLVLKKYFHIGFAADTPHGLVVPVIRDADRKGVLDLAKETAELAKLAREGKLKAADMQGGCFSISSLGGIGGTSFTPIINAPEVAILGVCRAATTPVWDGQAFVPRLILPLSLSYDHRVIDGALGARFNSYLAQLLADFRRVLL